MSSWTLLSNHARILLLISEDPRIRKRDLAAQTDLTERAVHRIVHDLVRTGVLTVTKQGRRNHYQLRLDAPLTDARCGTVGDFVSRFTEQSLSA